MASTSKPVLPLDTGKSIEKGHNGAAIDNNESQLVESSQPTKSHTNSLPISSRPCNPSNKPPNDNRNGNLGKDVDSDPTTKRRRMESSPPPPSRRCLTHQNQSDVESTHSRASSDDRLRTEERERWFKEQRTLSWAASLVNIGTCFSNRSAKVSVGGGFNNNVPSRYPQELNIDDSPEKA